MPALTISSIVPQEGTAVLGLCLLVILTSLTTCANSDSTTTWVTTTSSANVSSASPTTSPVTPPTTSTSQADSTTAWVTNTSSVNTSSVSPTTFPVTPPTNSTSQTDSTTSNVATTSNENTSTVSPITSSVTLTSNVPTSSASTTPTAFPVTSITQTLSPISLTTGPGTPSLITATTASALAPTTSPMTTPTTATTTTRAIALTTASAVDLTTALSSSTPSPFPITTTNPTVLPTTPPGSTPVDLSSVFIKIELSIAFNIQFVNDLTNKNSAIYRTYEADLLNQINLAFRGCPGFSPSLTVIVSFSEGSVVANYGTSYDASYVVKQLDSVAAIIKYIETVAFQQLKNASLNNTKADANYLNSTALEQLKKSGSQLTAAKQNLCSASTSKICTVCSTCNFDAASSQVYCSPLCKGPETVCTFYNSSNENDAKCSCATNYLPVSGTGCVHQRVIIGASVGVVGGVLVILVISLIVVSVKLCSVVKALKYCRSSPSSSTEASHDRSGLIQLQTNLTQSSSRTSGETTHVYHELSQPDPGSGGNVGAQGKTAAENSGAIQVSSNLPQSVAYDDIPNKEISYRM